MLIAQLLVTFLWIPVILLWARVQSRQQPRIGNLVITPAVFSLMAFLLGVLSLFCKAPQSSVIFFFYSGLAGDTPPSQKATDRATRRVVGIMSIVLLGAGIIAAFSTPASILTVVLTLILSFGSGQVLSRLTKPWSGERKT